MHWLCGVKLFAKVLEQRAFFPSIFSSSPGKMCALQLGSACGNLNTWCSREQREFGMHQSHCIPLGLDTVRAACFQTTCSCLDACHSKTSFQIIRKQLITFHYLRKTNMLPLDSLICFLNDNKSIAGLLGCAMRRRERAVGTVGFNGCNSEGTCPSSLQVQAPFVEWCQWDSWKRS